MLEREILARLRPVLARSQVVPNKTVFIRGRVKGKSVLDLGCVGHSVQLSEDQGDLWLHAVLSREAASIVGVDLLEAETAELRERGWNILCRDVMTMDLGRRFDVVVAADLLEHLPSFEGFFRSVLRHMADGGELVISTPNALGLVQFLYTGLRGMPLVSPDHTCWFDPKSLTQLAGRYGLVPVQLAWIRNSWRPSHFLLHGLNGFGLSDFFTGDWSPTPNWLRWLRAGLQRVALAPVDLVPLLFAWRKYWSSDFVLVFQRGSTPISGAT